MTYKTFPQYLSPKSKKNKTDTGATCQEQQTTKALTSALHESQKVKGVQNPLPVNASLSEAKQSNIGLKTNAVIYSKNPDPDKFLPNSISKLKLR